MDPGFERLRGRPEGLGGAVGRGGGGGWAAARRPRGAGSEACVGPPLPQMTHGVTDGVAGALAQVRCGHRV